MPECAGCGKRIVGGYLDALGAKWHPGCFRCASCGEALASGFIEAEGRPYHEACYHARFSPRCAGCGLPVSGQYTTALGAAWHPEHFTCRSCGRPLGSGFIEQDGAPYHSECYTREYAPRCAVCGTPMTGEYVVNGWGEQYCPRHERELSHCYTCGRPVSDLTGGGTRYPDGRQMCALCRRTAVDEPRRAAEVAERVRLALAREGLEVPGPLVVRLSDQPGLSALSSHAHAPDPSGMALTRAWTREGREVGRELQEIIVLQGLPEEHFAAVVAHELGHAWLFLNRFPRLNTGTEEGICELFAHLWLRSLGTREAEWRLRVMQANADPVYGGGYRAALLALQGRTPRQLLEEVRQRGE